MWTNDRRHADWARYNTSAYLRVGAGRSENPGVGGSIPFLPTRGSRRGSPNRGVTRLARWRTTRGLIHLEIERRPDRNHPAAADRIAVEGAVADVPGIH